MSLFLLLFSLFAWLSYFPQGFGQASHCQTPNLPGLNQQEVLEQFGPGKYYQRDLPDTYLIPIVFYIFHNNNPFAIREGQVLAQLDQLNRDFAPYHIQFCLATQKDGHTLPLPDGPTIVDSYSVAHHPGIIYVNDPVFGAFGGFGFLNASHETTINQYTGLSGGEYLKVFLLDVTMGSYTYYPSIVPLQREAIYMSYRQFGVPGICRACFPEAQAGTFLAHEVGHYFNLLHVLHPNACNESNCQTQGDYCCDTPPVNYPVNFLGCRSRNLSGCPETTLPLQHNYMDYIRSECMSVFTPDQVHRMHSSLLVYPQRINLWSEANLQQTGVACRPGQFPTGTCNLTTYFDYTEHPAANCQVQFENLSWVRPGAFAQSWDWDFGDGTSSNLKNPIHQYASTGTYDVCLVVHGKSKDGGSCTDTWCTTLVVGSCAPANDQGCFLSGSPDLWPLNCYTEFRANLHLPANGTVSHLEWNFGDGNTSNNPRPVHQYTQPGTYPVSLSATVVTAVGEVCDWYYSENLEVHCDLSTVNFFRTTGAEELSSQSNSDWKIFPNPATSWVGISSEGPLPTIVRVFDLQRKEIQVTVKPTSHVLRLSTHHLPSGLYLLELSNSLTTEHQWLVVAPE